jgi:hypothetical protein
MPSGKAMQAAGVHLEEEVQAPQIHQIQCNLHQNCEHRDVSKCPTNTEEHSLFHKTMDAANYCHKAWPDWRYTLAAQWTN